MDLAAPSLEICRNHPDVTSGLVRCAGCGQLFCPDCVVELEGKPYDAACKEERVRDLQAGTAEVPMASRSARFGGAFLDGLVFSPLTIALAVIYAGETSMFRHYLPRVLLPAALVMLYEGLMLQATGGKTLGKMAAKTRVVNLDGSPIAPRQAWIRAVSRCVMNLTYVLAVVDIAMIFSASRRMLHDRIAGTMVVNTRA